MCLTTKLTAPVIAEKDIVCYKLLRKDNGEYQTPYFNAKVPEDVLNGKKPFTPASEPIIEVNGGYIHCFNYYVGKQFTAPGNCLFKCIIPKGEQYWIGNNGDYAATEIIFKEKVYETEDDIYTEKCICDNTYDYTHFNDQMTLEEINAMEATEDDIEMLKYLIPDIENDNNEEATRLLKVFEIARRSSYSKSVTGCYYSNISIQMMMAFLEFARRCKDIKPEDIPYDKIHQMYNKASVPWYVIIAAVVKNLDNLDKIEEMITKINDTKNALREMEKEISNYYFEDRDEILDEIVTEKLEVEEYSIFKED